MTRTKTYSREQLIQLYREAEVKFGPIKSTQLKNYGLPNMNAYNSEFGSWNRFLQVIGKNIQLKKHRRKNNLRRYFTSDEYNQIHNHLKNPKHLTQFLILTHTGMRINEARNIDVNNIDFNNKIIKIFKKNKEKIFPMSDYLTTHLRGYVAMNILPVVNSFEFPSTYALNKRIKNIAKKAGIQDYEDCSAMNLRHTYLNGVLKNGQEQN